MSCSVCAEIPDAQSANTGRDMHLPRNGLNALNIDRREDLQVCPECHSVFLYEDDQAWTGSGNNDEERLTRFSREQSDLMDLFLRRRDVRELAERFGELLALPHDAGRLVLRHVLPGNPELDRALLPAYVRHGLTGHLEGLASRSSDHARAVLAAIGSTMPKVAAHCLRKLCRICDEDTSALQRFGDFGECPGCHPGFLVGTRLQPYMSDAMRACVHHGCRPIPDYAAALVIASDGARLYQALLAYALKSDLELVRLLMPHLAVDLANRGADWLYAWLKAWAKRGDAERAQVREAVSRIDPRKHYRGERAAALASALR